MFINRWLKFEEMAVTCDSCLDENQFDPSVRVNMDHVCIWVISLMDRPECVLCVLMCVCVSYFIFSGHL